MIHHGPDLGEATTFPHIVYSAPFHLRARDGLSASWERIRETSHPLVTTLFFFASFLLALRRDDEFLLRFRRAKTLQAERVFLVVDRIWEARRRELQGIGKLRDSKWNPNGGGSGASTSPKSSSWDIASTKEFLVLPMQGSGALLSKPNFPLPRSSRFEEKSLANQASTSLVTIKEPKKFLSQDGEARGAQL